jgi:hypothetical protein
MAAVADRQGTTKPRPIRDAYRRWAARVRTDDWGQKQLGQLVQVVLAGVFGIAERMADGSVDTLDGDDFYNLPKYW